MNDYVKGTVIPQVQPNLAFIVMALVALLVFLLWRMIRQCCLCCCMKRSCKESREAADPEEVLSGWRFWLIKGLVLLFAVASLGMMLAGIITAPKELFVEVWPPVDRFNSYLNDTAGTMNTLAMDLDHVNPILNNLTYIANNDINIPAIRANLQTISTTLSSSAANPNNLDTQLSSLDASVASIKSQIAAVRTNLGSGGVGGSVDTLGAGLPAWATATTTFGDYNVKLNALNIQFSALSAASGPVYDTTLLDAAMKAADVAAWQTNVDKMVAAIDAWLALQSQNSLANLATSITQLEDSVKTLNNTQIPASTSALRSFTAAWTAVLTPIKALLDRIDSIQANVVVLDANSTATLQRVRSLYANLVALTTINPSPTALADNLAALTGQLSLGPVAALVTSLNALQTALGAVPSSTLQEARAEAAKVKSALDDLAGPKATTQSAIDDYVSSPNAGTFAAMKTQAVDNTQPLSQTAETTSDTASTNTSVIAVQGAVTTSGMASQVDALKTNMASVDASLAASAASIDSKVPSLAPYRSQTSGIKDVYNNLPQPNPAKDLDSVIATCDKLQNLVVTVPANVRSQVASVKSSVRSGVQSLREDVVVEVQDQQDSLDDSVEMVDVSRYRATCVVFGLAGFALVVLVLVVLINCPWGIGCCIFFLLLLAVLLFLLAAVFAAVLVGLQEGCYHSEKIVLDSVGSDALVKPLLEYYFFGNDTTSVKTVLKDAGLVDVDKVTSSVVNQTDGIISDFNRTYTPRTKVQTVFLSIKAFVNETLGNVEAVLQKANVVNVRPLYIDVKEFPCCDVAGYSYTAWVLFTFGGWLIFVTCNLAMSFLGILDTLPQSGCMGCKPLLKSRFRNKVHPENDPEGKAEKAVVLNPMDAPGQMAMGGAAAADSTPVQAYDAPSPQGGAPPPPPPYNAQPPYGAPAPPGYGAPPPPGYGAPQPPMYDSAYGAPPPDVYGGAPPPPAAYNAPPPGGADDFTAPPPANGAAAPPQRPPSGQRN